MYGYGTIIFFSFKPDEKIMDVYINPDTQISVKGQTNSWIDYTRRKNK